MEKKILDELKQLKQIETFKSQVLTNILTELKGIRRELENSKIKHN